MEHESAEGKGDSHLLQEQRRCGAITHSEDDYQRIVLALLLSSHSHPGNFAFGACAGPTNEDCFSASPPPGHLTIISLVLLESGAYAE